MSNAVEACFEEGKQYGALLMADKIINLVREMPNADDRYNKLCEGAVPKMLDGGSVHRFTLIERIKKLKKEGVEQKKISDLKEFLKLLQKENEEELERCIHDYNKFGYNFALDRKWKFNKFINELEGVEKK